MFQILIVWSTQCVVASKLLLSKAILLVQPSQSKLLKSLKFKLICPLVEVVAVEVVPCWMPFIKFS